MFRGQKRHKRSNYKYSVQMRLKPHFTDSVAEGSGE